MTYRTPNFNQKVNKKAIAWALFSQSIWLPVLLTDTQDHIASKNTDYDFSGVAANIPNQNLPESLVAASSRPKGNLGLIAKAPGKLSETSGVVLNAILPKERSIQSKLEGIAPKADSDASPLAFMASIRPPSISLPFQFNSKKSEPVTIAPAATVKVNQSSDLLRRLYTRSDLLGGVLTLRDLNEPLMPPIARAERAQSVRSGDPLSTIPQMWREPMRKALKSLAENLNPTSNPSSGIPRTAITVDQARVIHVPSSRVKHFSEVPLALQSDGTVDILNSPDDPDVVEEIKAWSTKQQLPAKGRMAPAVVHLHPLPQQEKFSSSGGHPTSEKITSPSSKSSQYVEAKVEPLNPTPAVVNPIPSEVKEAAIPDVLPQLPSVQASPTPPPPPPIPEAHTSELPTPESATVIAAGPVELTTPASEGVVQ